LDIGARTGGGEALFQLRLDLEKLGYICKMVALNENIYNLKLPDKFTKYISSDDDICRVADIIDNDRNCFIVPETATNFLLKIKYCQKIIWWLSTEYYDGKIREHTHYNLFDSILKNTYSLLRYIYKNIKNTIKYKKNRYPLSEALNISNFYYCKDVLINKYNIESELLIHSIGIDFLKRGMYTSATGRENIVLYNPKKPSTVMRKLLKRNKFNYVPVENLSVDEMISLFRKSKVYVDFGQFPGPERLPKETVYNGVNVIVGKNNAATNYQDVMVPEEFKISCSEKIEFIEEKIQLLIDDYEKYSSMYDDYRNMIFNMEKNYYAQLENIFGNKR
jgi:hypothetical protein